MKLFRIIRQKLKKRYDAIDNTNLKRDLLNAFPFWLGAILTGLLAILYAQVFAWAEDAGIFLFHTTGRFFFIIAPTLFVISTWLVLKYAPYSRGSGIPQVTAAIELSIPKYNHKVNKLLSLRIIFIKIISSLTMILGGGAIGREGPTIQISASIFKRINDALPEWYPKISKRNMIVTGAAAGLASAFNTPLGGIVFAIEELTKTHFSFFKSALLTGVIIAGLTALNLSGPYLYLGYPQTSNISSWMILAILPVAFLTGIGGSGTGKMILYVLHKKRNIRNRPRLLLFAAFSGLLIACLAFFADSRVLGSGKSIILTSLFTDDKKIEWYVPLLRIFGPVLSFTTGASGGIFAPALSAGASIGAVISNWFNLSSTETNLIILCGMAGFLTGITRSPFTSSILVIEMTNDHNIIFHLMLTALFANMIANTISRRSFYDQLKDQYIRDILKDEISEKSA